MPKDLHKRLKELRLKAGFATQKHFVAYAGRMGYPITRQRYGALERGDSVPGIKEVVSICRLLGISTDTLLIGNSNQLVISGLGEKGSRAMLRIADEIRKLEQ